MALIYLTDEEAKTETTIKKAAIRYSKKYPNHYITVHPGVRIRWINFGLTVTIQKRLSVHTPNDSVFDWYVLNEKVKPFTKQQKIKAQNATNWGF